jgi:MFS family permease
MTDKKNPVTALAWLICALVSTSMLGNFYVYDSIGPVATLLQQQRGFSSLQVGTLNAIYSLPNVVLILVGGILVDRFGAARMTLITSAICLAGAALTAYSPNFFGMATGRLLFGIGAETFNIATLAAITDYFTGGPVAFAMGLSLSISRLGSYAADQSTDWFAGAYAQGWQPPLEIAVAFAALSFGAAVLYWRIDRGPARTRAASTPVAEKFRLRDLGHFGRAYWYLLALCVLWYSVILAFRSTYAITYFQHVHGVDLATAGTMNGYVYLAAAFATPIFGLVCDQTKRYAPFLAFGALLLPISLGVLALTHWSLWVATALLGVSYSLVPAVMWPLTSRLVPATRFGTALGLMWVIQNAGIAGANLAAGWLNDRAGASAQNPAGYDDMMMFFGASSAAGLVCAIVLWLTAGRRVHEKPAAVPA